MNNIVRIFFFSKRNFTKLKENGEDKIFRSLLKDLCLIFFIKLKFLFLLFVDTISCSKSLNFFLVIISIVFSMPPYENG